MRLILSSDWHLRGDRPTWRALDSREWMGLQKESLDFVFRTADDLDASILNAGDTFHKSRPELEEVNLLLRYQNKDVRYIYGNHDLLFHSYDNRNLAGAGIIAKLPGWIEGKEISPTWASFGTEPDPESEEEIVVRHILTFPDAESRPSLSSGVTAEELLAFHPKAKWIFVGDYHRAFHYEKNGRHVVNSGCLTRQAVDFADYRPTIAVIDTENGSVEFRELPDCYEIPIPHIQDKRDRENRLESFVESLGGDSELGDLDFEAALDSRAESLGPVARKLLTELKEEIRNDDQ